MSDKGDEHFDPSQLNIFKFRQLGISPKASDPHHEQINTQMDEYLKSSINSPQQFQATLDLSEHLEMLFTRKRMTLLYKILMAWRAETRRNLQSSEDTVSSFETHKARMRFKEL